MLRKMNFLHQEYIEISCILLNLSELSVLNIKKEDVVLLPMKQLPTRALMTQK